MEEIFIQIFSEGSMKISNCIEVTENFYEFFAPYFLDIISHINDPREQDNYNLRYSLSSYLSVLILGLCQGATSMRQIVLFSKDEAFRERASFLFAGANVAQSQNAFTNLVEQRDPHAFQERYNMMLHELSHSGALAPFAVQGLRIGALDGIELHQHIYTDRQNVTACAYCLKRRHKKGRRKNVKHVFTAPLCSRLWATPGVFFVSKSLSSASRMALRKVQRKKRPSGYSIASTRTISSI